MRRRFLGLAVFGMLLSGVAANAGTEVVTNPFGDWVLSDGRLTVRAFKCKVNLVCANVIHLPEPNNADGTPKLDLKNKNPALRSRHLIGMPVIDGMASTGINTWQGSIYNSDDGEIYRAYARISGDHLDVKGCWFVVCRNLSFNRAK